MLKAFSIKVAVPSVVVVYFRSQDRASLREVNN